MPPSLRYFEPMRLLPNAHNEFMSLEYDLVEALAPKLIVDVGAGDAQSYFTFCQSVRDHDIDALCYAIDEWADDESKPPEDESRFAFINHFAHNEMRGIAYLLQMSARDALMHFEPGMIDLLRLDVRRTAQQARELLDEWLPRVAPGGVLMYRGAPGKDADELSNTLNREGTRRWDLHEGEGLVLVRVGGGDVPDEALPDLLKVGFCGSTRDQEALARWYAHAAEHHRLRASVRAARWGLGVKKNPRKS